MKIITTLCIVHQHPKVLLGMKKKGFGAGRWNGFGGKVNDGETIEEAAKRELFEEAGIQAEIITKLGFLEFEFEKTGKIIEVHVFKLREFRGEPMEGEEMKPEWFFIDEIPFQSMWPDDVYWMPMFLSDKNFIGKFVFGEGDVILDKNLKEVKSF